MHIFIDVVVKVLAKCFLFHKKIPPFYRKFLPNKPRVFIGLSKKVYSLKSAKKPINFDVHRNVKKQIHVQKI